MRTPGQHDERRLDVLEALDPPEQPGGDRDDGAGQVVAVVAAGEGDGVGADRGAVLEPAEEGVGGGRAGRPRTRRTTTRQPASSVEVHGGSALLAR